MSDVRCAFCHDALVEGGTGADERVECGGCRTLLHWDCRALLARCPTLGCKDASLMKGGRVAVARPAFLTALARLRATGRHVETNAIEPEVSAWVPKLSVEACEVCGQSTWFAWNCPSCRARRHVLCAMLGPEHLCPHSDEVPPIPLPTNQVNDDQGRDSGTFRSALERLKKRPKRD